MRSIERLYVMVLVLLPASGLLVVNHAAAQPARPGHATILEVPDATLGQLRGRFTLQGQVVEFGVSMMSRWQLGSGEILMATARLQVDLSDGLSQPQVVFVPNLTVLDPATAGVGSPNIVVGGAGTNRIGGLAQLIQVAGDHNDVINQAALLITDQSLDNSPAGIGEGNELVQHSPSGATLQAAINNGGMAVKIDAPGFGVVSQQIRGAGVSGGNTPGILQRVLIAGDMHTVHNLLDISVRVAPQAAVGAVAGALRPDLSLLHGIRHAGLF